MLEKIVAAVRAAGDMIRDAHNIERDTREKTGAADLVTKYDVAVQEFLRRELLGICPEADFFGEEGEHPALTRPWVFVVDPIDGTTNFTRRMNYSSISVALVHNGQTEYGVVYNPYVGELFAARRGHGATLNGAPIHVSGNDVPHAIVVCGSTIYDRTYTDRNFSILRRLYDRCLDYRRFAHCANRALWTRLLSAERQLRQWGVQPLRENDRHLVTAQEARQRLRDGQAVTGRLTPLARDILEGRQ